MLDTLFVLLFGPMLFTFSIAYVITNILGLWTDE